MVRTGGLLLAAMLACAIAAPQTQAQEREAGCAMTRAGEYERAAPASVGLDRAKLQEALDYGSLMGSNSLKVFRHGCLVGEGSKDKALERVPDNNWGQTKTVVALLTGVAADKGLLDLDAPIGTYLQPGLGDAAHRAVTLRHLLHAASGAEVNQVRGLNFAADVSRTRDWFKQPIKHEPGSYYFYDQAATSVIVYVTERVTGEDYQDFAQRELFDKLGIPKSAYFWQRDREGTTSGYSQLFMRPLEFGRFGELLNRNGFYEDRQVVSASYMANLRTPSPANCGYSFLTFLNSCTPDQTRVDVGVPVREQQEGAPWISSAPSDMVFTDGVGTRLYVIPSLDLVVTRSGAQEFDAVPAAATGDVNSVVPGRPGARGTHDFFRKLMASVDDMPDDVRATIANSGAYDGPRRLGFDATNFVNQPLAAPGTTLGVGPDAPEGCNPLGCEGESNDGIQRTVTDAPRVIPGVIGKEERPDG